MKKYLSLLPMLALILPLNGCTTLGEIAAPTLYLANISLTDATLFEQRYRLQFRIQNPNPVDLPIDGIAYELDINGKLFAQGVSNQSITVPRYGSALLDVEATSTLWDILQRAGDLQQSKIEQLHYRLKGKLDIANGKQVPFDYRKEF